MAGDDDLHREFEAITAGDDLDDLRAVSDLLVAANVLGFPMPRPNLRRPRLPQVLTYRIRADLDNSEPSIWRMLEVRSDLTLDVVHSLLQGAFRWTNSHSHRFALGGGPFDLHSQLYLCPLDVEEGTDEGIPDLDVRLDETLQDVGDVLRYVYDFGDAWEITLRLEQVREAIDDDPLAVCVEGQRAAPPEDCGGLTRVEDLAKVIDDPAFFDIDETNRWLIDPFLLLRKADVHPALTDVLLRLRSTPLAEVVITQAMRLTEPGPSLTERDLLRSLRPILWFLDRAQGEGIPLTDAGYLTPAVVAEAAAVVPCCSGWIGELNREVDVQPLVSFRKALQKFGLLRKAKARLVLTKAGQTARVEHGKLWGQLASRMIPGKAGFLRDGVAVVLLFASVSPEQRLPTDLIEAVIAALGWRHEDGTPADFYDVRWGTPVMDLLYNVGEPSEDLGMPDISRVAAALAREALFKEG